MPAASVACAVRLWLPAARAAAGVRVQAPPAPACAVPTSVAPSNRRTQALASAVPVMTGRGTVTPPGCWLASMERVGAAGPVLSTTSVRVSAALLLIPSDAVIDRAKLPSLPLFGSVAVQVPLMRSSVAVTVPVSGEPLAGVQVQPTVTEVRPGVIAPDRASVALRVVKPLA